VYINWYEWLDEVLSFVDLFFEFGVSVRILNFVYGTRKPYRILYSFSLFGLFITGQY
jgi:hypothetical protein